MKTYDADIEIKFTGKISVNAKDKLEAKQLVEQFFHVHSPIVSCMMPQEIIPDWNFSLHPESKTISNLKVNHG